jgi:hypothetical protein
VAWRLLDREWYQGGKRAGLSLIGTGPGSGRHPHPAMTWLLSTGLRPLDRSSDQVT